MISVIEFALFLICNQLNINLYLEIEYIIHF
jgi:hypothetical protein